MRVTLHVIAGPQTGRVFIFDEHDTFTIGRSEESAFCLPHDRFFSRHHCLIEIAPPQAFLRDLGSTNGTYVNDLRVETAHLQSGDRIQGGETILEVEVTTVAGAADEAEGKYMKSLVSRVSVLCLNCRAPAAFDASHAEAQLSYICDNCREELKKTPQQIPNYQTIRVIGQGGMGSVALARSERDGQPVAIKTLLPEVAVSEQALKRFLREIEVASSLKHPNIVRYIEHGKHEGIIYLITEFVNGSDAARLARNRGGKLGHGEVVRIVDQTLAALDFAHERGFVHRDIKEQNILIQGEYPNSIAKLTDFGLSKSFKETGMSGVTMVGDVAGTIAYMPPEQVRDFKDVKPPSDIYAVGMMAYTLLTGTNALGISAKAGIAETVKAIFEKPIIPVRERIPDVPERIASVIETALSKRVEDRWKTSGAMREALLAAASNN
ncbi:MAG: protein kinase domain-containing protein [Pyrinomonadaceae bacterium]